MEQSRKSRRCGQKRHILEAESAVLPGLRDPATVAMIADRAQCSANTARTHLEEFVTLGIVRKYEETTETAKGSMRRYC